IRAILRVPGRRRSIASLQRRLHCLSQSLERFSCLRLLRVQSERLMDKLARIEETALIGVNVSKTHACVEILKSEQHGTAQRCFSSHGPLTRMVADRVSRG